MLGAVACIRAMARIPMHLRQEDTPELRKTLAVRYNIDGPRRIFLRICKAALQ